MSQQADVTPPSQSPDPPSPSPASAAAEELPKALIRRIIKENLSSIDADNEFSVHKDAVLAFADSARIFIHYLSATANDNCKESRRQTINADDVLTAIEDMEFAEFVEPLKAALDEFRRKNKLKKSTVRSTETSKKRKVEEEPPTKNKELEINGTEDEELPMKSTENNAYNEEAVNDVNNEEAGNEENVREEKEQNDDKVEDHCQ